jgi:antitoxin component YwqK of YwqJK toxin-antitoxin module
VIRFEQWDDRLLCGFNGLSKLDLFTGERKVGRIELLNGKRQLSETLWEDGKVRILSLVQEGRYIEKSYQSSGALAKEVEFGLYGSVRRKEVERIFHESGTKTAEKRWVQGQLILDRSWYLNGQAKTQDEFSGERQKSQRFHDNGVLAYEGNSIRERNSLRRIGVHRHLNEKGNLTLELTYDERGKISRERRLDETGQVLNDDAVFEDGSRRAFSK